MDDDQPILAGLGRDARQIAEEVAKGDRCAGPGCYVKFETPGDGHIRTCPLCDIRN